MNQQWGKKIVVVVYIYKFLFFAINRICKKKSIFKFGIYNRFLQPFQLNIYSMQDEEEKKNRSS